MERKQSVDFNPPKTDYSLSINDESAGGHVIIDLTNDINELRHLTSSEYDNTHFIDNNVSISKITIKSCSDSSIDGSQRITFELFNRKSKDKVKKPKIDRHHKLKSERYLLAVINFGNQPYYDEKSDLNTIKTYYSQLTDINNISYQQLHALTSKSKRSYSRGKEIYLVIDRQPDGTLRDVYTDKLMEYKNEISNMGTYNEEHSFPQCYQSGTKSGAGRDLHQLFASDKSVNYSRGKKPLGVLKDSVFIKDGKCGSIYKSERTKSFIPRCNKGAIARAFLYVLVCYGHICDTGKFPIEYLAYIIDTAVNEPVCLWEKHRNAEIYKRQCNRNPFIDYPEWAKKIDFESNGFR